MSCWIIINILLLSLTICSSELQKVITVDCMYGNDTLCNDTNNMDTLSDIQDPWSFAAVDTSHPFVNFLNSGQDSLDAHYHPSQFYSITKGSMNLPATLVLNNVQRGNMQPVNDSLEGIASIRVNTQTPQLNVLHIIRAY